MSAVSFLVELNLKCYNRLECTSKGGQSCGQMEHFNSFALQRNHALSLKRDAWFWLSSVHFAYFAFVKNPAAQFMASFCCSNYTNTEKLYFCIILWQFLDNLYLKKAQNAHLKWILHLLLGLSAQLIHLSHPPHNLHLCYMCQKLQNPNISLYFNTFLVCFLASAATRMFCYGITDLRHCSKKCKWMCGTMEVGVSTETQSSNNQPGNNKVVVKYKGIFRSVSGQQIFPLTHFYYFCCCDWTSKVWRICSSLKDIWDELWWKATYRMNLTQVTSKKICKQKYDKATASV